MRRLIAKGLRSLARLLEARAECDHDRRVGECRVCDAERALEVLAHRAQTEWIGFGAMLGPQPDVPKPYDGVDAPQWEEMGRILDRAKPAHEKLVDELAKPQSEGKVDPMYERTRPTLRRYDITPDPFSSGMYTLVADDELTMRDGSVLIVKRVSGRNVHVVDQDTGRGRRVRLTYLDSRVDAFVRPARNVPDLERWEPGGTSLFAEPAGCSVCLLTCETLVDGTCINCREAAGA